MKFQIVSTAAALMLASTVAHATDRTTEELNRRELARISAQQASNGDPGGASMVSSSAGNREQMAQSSSGGGTAGGSTTSGSSPNTGTGTGGIQGRPSDPNYRNSTRTPMDSVNPSAGSNRGSYGTTPDPMNTPESGTTPYTTPRGSQSTVDCSSSANRNDPACTPR